MNKKKDLSREDVKVWEEYTKNPTDIYDKERNLKVSKRNKRFKFDLHGFTLEEANLKVKELIFFCSMKSYREILFITGKGIHSTNDQNIYSSRDFGKLKFSVPEFIKSDQELTKLIISIEEADVKDGGEGAILIKLKNL